MSTIDSKEFIDNIIKNNGFYNGDDDNSMGDNPRCVTVTEYTNSFGKVTWGVTFEGERNKYLQATVYVQNPHVIWQYKAGA